MYLPMTDEPKEIITDKKIYETKKMKIIDKIKRFFKK